MAVAVAFTVIASAAISCAATLAWHSHSTSNSATTLAAPTTQSAAPATRFKPEEIAAAKEFLCHTFDVSVRGQTEQGGLRVEGNLNVPAALRSVNSAVAVRSAIVPMLPADVADAARKYVATTLDVTTAVMGNPRADEVNRLIDVGNIATHNLLDVCGLPR